MEDAAACSTAHAPAAPAPAPAAPAPAPRAPASVAAAGAAVRHEGAAGPSFALRQQLGAHHPLCEFGVDTELGTVLRSTAAIPAGELIFDPELPLLSAPRLKSLASSCGGSAEVRRLYRDAARGMDMDKDSFVSVHAYLSAAPATRKRVLSDFCSFEVLGAKWATLPDKPALLRGAEAVDPPCFISSSFRATTRLELHDTERGGVGCRSLSGSVATCDHLH